MVDNATYQMSFILYLAFMIQWQTGEKWPEHMVHGFRICRKCDYKRFELLCFFFSLVWFNSIFFKDAEIASHELNLPLLENLIWFDPSKKKTDKHFGEKAFFFKKKNYLKRKIKVLMCVMRKIQELRRIFKRWIIFIEYHRKKITFWWSREM